MELEFPYICKGESIIRSIVSEEKDKFLAVASLANLNKYIPNVNVAQNVDLLGIAFDAFVANRFNKNDDVSDSKTSVAIAKLFVNKPINIEHKRDKVMGVVLNYAFTKFGSNDPLTEEEALASTDPFNVTLGGVLWRVVNQKMAKFIEECSDPTSEHFQKVSASWELGFLGFSIAKVEGDSKNLADATIITDKDEIKALKGYMKAFEGKGSKGDVKLYRLIQGEALPLGIGLTGSPAGEVKGVATDKTIEPEENDETEATETPINEEQSPHALNAKITQDITSFKESLEIVASKNDKPTENISQTTKNIVIQEDKILKFMKIAKLEDITDDALKQAKASDVTEFLKDEMKKASEAFVTEKNQLETTIKASKEATDKITTEHGKISEELKKVNETLATLQKEKEDRQKQDTFNTRMAALDTDFDLVDAEREVIASEITSLDDTAFASYKKRLEILLAAKKKGKQSFKADDKSGNDQNGKDQNTKTKVPNKNDNDPNDDDDADDADDDDDTTKDKNSKKSAKKQPMSEAKASAKDVVDAALDNAKKDETKLPAAATAGEPSVLEKYAKAFAVDQWISDVKLTE